GDPAARGPRRAEARGGRRARQDVTRGADVGSCAGAVALALAPTDTDADAPVVSSAGAPSVIAYAWIDAPIATASNGLIPTAGSRPKKSATRSRTRATSVVPPTRSTWSICVEWSPA